MLCVKLVGKNGGMNMVGTCQTDRTGAGALGKLAVYSFQAIAPLTAQEKGVQFFGGAYFPQKLTPKSSIGTER
jgi:hypothetical protein